MAILRGWTELGSAGLLTCVLILGTTTQILKARLVDHIHGGEFNVSFKFYQGGHLYVSFPALPLIVMDDGCDFTLAASKVVEFAGVYMGESSDSGLSMGHGRLCLASTQSETNRTACGSQGQQFFTQLHSKTD
jgi:hypothetical protein